MKSCISLIVLLISAQYALATLPSFRYRNIQAGDTLYVAAKSGLNMRSAPQASASKLVGIPFSEYVIYAEQDFEATTLQVRESAEFVVHGRWCKVVYKGETGYVFDGYLTRFPNSGEDGRVGLLRHLKKTHQDNLHYAPHHEAHPCKAVEYYEKAVTHVFDECGEGGISASIILHDATLAEAYFIMRDMFFEEGVHKIRKSNSPEHIAFYVQMIEPDAGCEAQLRTMAGGGVVIEYSCGC